MRARDFFPVQQIRMPNHKVDEFSLITFKKIDDGGVDVIRKISLPILRPGIFGTPFLASPFLASFSGRNLNCIVRWANRDAHFVGGNTTQNLHFGSIAIMCNNTTDEIPKFQTETISASDGLSGDGVHFIPHQ